MTWQHDTMMNPPIEELLDRADSKFRLVTLGAKRARQINSYFGQLGDGLGTIVPPQVTSVARKPLSIAFEEIAADKIVAVDVPPTPRPVEAGEAAPTPTPTGRVGRAPTAEPTVDARRASAIVLGVTGGIAAYKAVEVCRRLVDAGAHVVAGHDRRVRRTSSAPPPSRRWPPSRCRRRCGTRPTRSRTPGSARPPTSRGRARPPPGCSAPTPPAAPHDLLTATLLATRAPVVVVPGDAHRDVGAPRGAGQPGHAAPPRRARRRARGGPPGRRRRRAPAAWPTPERDRRRGRRRRCTAARTSPGCACSSPPAAPASRSTRCASSATARRASRATPSPRRPRPAGAKVTLVTTVDLPAPAGIERRAGRHRRRDGAGGARPGRRGRRRRHGRRGRRLPARSTSPTDKIKKADGVPDDRASSRPPTSSPTSARRKRPGQTLVGFAAETDRPRAPTPRASSPARALDLIVANDVSAPGVGFEHDTNAGA